MRIYIYILLMFLTSITIRTLPIVLLKKPIENKYVKSFLYYVPYVTLSIMTVPAIINATSSFIPGLIVLIVGIVLSYKGAKLITVAISCSVIVFLFTLII